MLIFRNKPLPSIFLSCLGPWTFHSIHLHLTALQGKEKLQEPAKLTALIPNYFLLDASGFG